MQTIYLDLAQKNALQPVYAKLNDEVRKIRAVLPCNADADSTEHGTAITICLNRE